MSYIETLQDPELLAEMTIMEKLTAGFQVVVLGVTIVFIILILLIGFLKILEKISTQSTVQKKEKKEKSEARPAVDKAKTESMVAETELAAVITAAIYQGYYKNSGSDFVVRRITRLKDDTPLWGRLARGGQEIDEGGYEND